MNYESNVEFLKRVSDPLQGWLLPQAGIRTLDLLDWQAANGVRGGLLEIGVFAGKYFSLLLQSSIATQESILGVDTFQYVPLAHLMDLLGRTKLDIGRVQMIARPSSKVSAREIIRCLGGRARFISVDGSHLKPDVLHDLYLSDKVLSEQGIVAADDAFNVLCLGVNEAVCEFLPRFKRRLVPFGVIPNKLLLCRPAMRDVYAKVLEDALLAHPHDQYGENFKTMRGIDRGNVFTNFFGSPVLVAS